MSTLSAATLYRRIEPRAGLQWVAVAGGAALAAAALVLDPAQGWAGVLTAALFGIFLAMGGAIVLAVQAAAGARWWLPLRGVPLLLARTLPGPAAALAACFAFGLRALYPWASPGAHETLHGKEAWLSVPFFLARAVAILVAWFWLVGVLRQRLEEFSRQPSEAAQRRLARASIGFLAALAVTISVAAWDWAMSLEPEWFSTMYSVYVFSGAFLGGIAAVAALALMLDRAEMLEARLPESVVHDLGKLLFAFATFWAYTWFCQYLLIWYSNLPEETGHYAARLEGGWSMLFYLNPVLGWIVPFVTLLGAGPKRRPAVLLQVSLVVLIGRWLDIFLLVAPSKGPAPSFPLGAVGATAAVLGAMGLLWVRGLRRDAQSPASGVRAPAA